MLALEKLPSHRNTKNLALFTISGRVQTVPVRICDEPIPKVKRDRPSASLRMRHIVYRSPVRTRYVPGDSRLGA